MHFRLPRAGRVLEYRRMRAAHSLSFMLLGLLAACAADDDPDRIVTSRQELCAGRPVEHADGTSTMIGCAFEQHVENIVSFGDNHSGELTDSAGRRVRITSSCEDYVLGTDEDAHTVIVRRSSGAVISHGMTHPGQPISKLPSPLAMPLAVH